MKIIHTKDGRTLYKDDEGHWLKKDAAEKLIAQQKSSDVRDPEKDEQIKRGEEIARKLNQPTVYNEYGFEVTNNSAPDIEFTDLFWKKMKDLKNTANGYNNAFTDSYLLDKVRTKMYELGDSASDEAVRLWYRGLEGENVTDDERWASAHALAQELGIKTPRYSAGVGTGEDFYFDQQFGSIEEAEEWGRNRGQTHIYDRLTGKYSRIGGKKWIR